MQSEVVRLVRSGKPLWRACEVVGIGLTTLRRRYRLDPNLRIAIVLAYYEWLEESKKHPYTRSARKGRPLAP